MVIKRIVCLLTVVVLVCMLSLPAFAVGDGSGSLRYAALPFDQISFGTLYKTTEAWPAATFTYSGSRDFIGPFLDYVVDSNSDRSVIYTDVYTPYSATSIRLTASNVVVRVSDLVGFFVTLDVPNTFTVSYSGNLLQMERFGNVWRAANYYFSGSGTTADSWDIGKALSNSISYITPDEFVYLTSITVTISVLGDGFDGTYAFGMPASVAEYSFHEWMNQYDLTYKNVVVVDPASPDDVSFVDWLFVALGGFLEFELWPGMSINQLIQFILVLGLVFWFFTMLI